MSTGPGSGGYLLCGSPRGGSTMLCDLLRRSGLAGAPASLFRPAGIADGLNAEWCARFRSEMDAEMATIASGGRP